VTVPPALEPNEATSGLRRVVVPTAVGAVTVRVGREAGGAATILLHGAAGSWTTWTPLLAASDRLGRPLTDVVAIDLPGWGESPGPVPDAAALACLVADAARALGYQEWTLVGHSLGGAVALDVAARFTSSTRAVGLVSPSGAAVRDAVRRPLLGGLRLPWFAGMLLAMRLLRVLGRAAPHLLRTLRRTGLLRMLASPLFRAPVDRGVTDALADEIRPAAFVAAAGVARAHDEALWDRIPCPVRTVRGRHDVFARPDDTLRLARRVRDLDETVLDDSGHFAHIEQPERTLAALFPAAASPLFSPPPVVAETA
jgi:pimeloyl-ACP methyl ester carboxylesterase